MKCEYDKLYIIDAGSGIGYSIIWIAKALEDSDCKASIIDAIEINSKYSIKAVQILNQYKFKNVKINVINDDAIDYISKLKEDSIDIAFIDIEKQLYMKAIELLSRKVKTGGLILFHNAIKPPPPKTFLEKARTPPWKSTVIIPTAAGILLSIKQ